MNENMSMVPAVEVTVGVPDAFHFTPVNVAVPPPVEAACLRNNIKLLPAVAVGMVKVQAVLAVRVAVCTVPLDNDMVLEVVTVPIATTPSV